MSRITDRRPASTTVTVHVTSEDQVDLAREAALADEILWQARLKIADKCRLLNRFNMVRLALLHRLTSEKAMKVLSSALQDGDVLDEFTRKEVDVLLRVQNRACFAWKRERDGGEK